MRQAGFRYDGSVERRAYHERWSLEALTKHFGAHTFQAVNLLNGCASSQHSCIGSAGDCRLIGESQRSAGVATTNPVVSKGPMFMSSSEISLRSDWLVLGVPSIATFLLSSGRLVRPRAEAR